MLLSQADAYARPQPEDFVWLFVFAIAVIAVFVTLSVNAAVRHKTADPVQALLTMFGPFHRALNGWIILFVCGGVVIFTRQYVVVPDASSGSISAARFVLLLAILPIGAALMKASWCLIELAAFCFLAWRQRSDGLSRMNRVRSSLKQAAFTRHDLGPIRRASYKLAHRTLSLIHPSTR